MKHTYDDDDSQDNANYSQSNPDFPRVTDIITEGISYSPDEVNVEFAAAVELNLGVERFSPYEEENKIYNARTKEAYG